MYDFTINDGTITVGSSYFGQDVLNVYFQKHRLKKDYPMDEVANIIDAVAFVLDGKGGSGDYLTIELMLD